jgi:peptidoglycan/LPS O-acetylase OafA/YrhL
MLCGVVAISILARTACYFLIPHEWSDPDIVGNHAEAFIYYFTLTRLDSIGIGCILSLSIDRFAEKPGLYSSKALWTYTVCAIVLIFFGMHCKPFYYTVGSAIVALAVGAFITALWLGASNGVSRILASEPLVEIGRVSYGIYLFQTIPIHWLLRRIVIGDLEWLVWIVFVVAIAEAHYRWVEKYFLSLRGGS